MGEVKRQKPTEAEASVLGAILLDNAALQDVAETLRPEDFADERHRTIFRAMLDLKQRGAPIDEVSLSSHLKATGKIANAGGELYAYQLVERTPTSANVATYASAVREASGVRELYIAARDAMRAIDDGGDSSGVRERLIATVARIDAREPHRFADMHDELNLIVREMTARHEKGVAASPTSFVKTGWREMDKAIVGWGAGQLVLIAARARMGKTALAIGAAANLAIADERVVFFSAEMTKEELARRALAAIARVLHKKLRAGFFEGDDWSKAIQAAGKIQRSRFLVDDQSPISTREIMARASRANRAGRISAIFVDYAQKVQAAGNFGTREQEVARIAKDLKDIAKTLRVPVIALAQTNQKGGEDFETRGNDRMMRESDVLFQEADVVLHLKRKYVYDKDADPRDALIEVVKQRDGEEVDFHLDFIGEHQRFTDPETPLTSTAPPPTHWMDRTDD